MRHGSLFSGIGGFDIAAEWMGWENVFHCEINDFSKRILRHYWPNAISYDDIKKTDFTIHRGTIDIITGGFPCQPYSLAGKRLGKEDARHLWPEMLRTIQEIEPSYIVGENVRGLTNWNGGVVFEEVCADLEACGYEVQPILLPACAVGAPHRRDRIWFIATNTNNIRQHQCECDNEINTSEGRINAFNDIDEDIEQRNATNTTSARRGENNGFRESGFNDKNCQRNDWNNFPTQSPICGGDDGLPTELDGITFSKWRAESIKAGGNAIVPQVAYEIFKAIKEIDLMGS